MAAISGFGSALPAGPVEQQALWDGYFAAHYRHDRVAAAVWRLSGVRTRHGVADPRSDDVARWSTGQRMRRFVAEALPLGKEAVDSSLADAGRAADDVDQLTVVSCTGYATPGLDVLIARDLGLPASAQRLHVGHMGCYAALPALATAADAADARGMTAVVACVELTSLHVQPPAPDTEPVDREQVVAHALFADAAAAVVVEPGDGWRVDGFVARTDAQHAGLMSWDVTDLGFRMGLSPQVPAVLAEHVDAAVAELLAPRGLAADDVAAWAVHPGGPRIVDIVAEQLDLDDRQVADSRSVLAEVGNCSSATVLLILQRLAARRDLPPNAPVVVLAFGPGLTLHAALLRAR